MNGKRDPRKPDWWFWIYDWSNAVKKRTGWSDEKLADAIGVSVRTLNHMKKEAYTGRMGATLRLLALYQDVTKGGK
nr:MAG TPA: regulatory protein/DNA complex-sensing repressor [Bacteriophage sp.]